MNKTAVIDCDSIIFTAFHPNKILDAEGNPLRENNKFVYQEKTEEEVLKATDSLMHTILSSGKFTHYIGFVKGKNTTAERLACDSNYKANRPKQSPKFWNLTKQYLIDKWGVIEVNNIEVDDAVNITRLELNSHIVAIDNDLLALKGKHYNWRKNQWIEVDAEQAEEKFWSDMICGQPGDNIPGLPGKGIKFVKKLFEDPTYLSYPKQYLVYKAYVLYYKDMVTALEQYFKTFTCLKIKEEHEGFIIPEMIKYKGRSQK